ncbi:putative carbonic anhydrase 4-like [Scophthalmus maximus]|uniref:Carbonic anhydrase n=1 Tax=Scophthalmus maximus TaxID=52904 RepID=A0A2U9CLX6_SCOMX|nr:putative carbonic anhydrase 4-like [Scophthalmus maximus]
MNSLVAAVLTVCALVSSVHCASESIAWCYHLPSCNDNTWPTISPQYCNGNQQSPINIVPASAKFNANLTDFTFKNFNSISALESIKNTGKTVKVTFGSGVQVSGGDLSEAYDSLQFHLHWGNGSSVPGSEHTVDGKRYPMELHIVNVKASYNGNTTQAVADSKGLAALGFFIEEMSGTATGQPASWKTLTSYLTNIKDKDDSVSIASGISLDDLLDGVNRSRYYRYLGSLTTPACNEAVVWTVFKEPIKVSKDLIDLFSTTMYVTNSSSPLMTNVFRKIQPEQPVTESAGSSIRSASTACYSKSFVFIDDNTWPTISPQYCNGTRQSPINIVSSNSKPDASLTAFTFKNFDNTSVLKSIKNTGGTVKVTFGSGVQVSGGGLSEAYDSLQFHLHWGNGSSVPGSEHTVDGKRYPMELHIVNSKASYNGNTTQAVADSKGLAVLGFFIEEMSGTATGQPASWKTLTSYLTNIKNKDDSVSIASGISLDDLLDGVNLSRYYRYLGSLTTPACNEAVVWNVFKEPIKVSKDLIDLFSTTIHINNSSSPLMTNVFRKIQPDQPVTESAGISSRED